MYHVEVRQSAKTGRLRWLFIEEKRENGEKVKRCISLVQPEAQFVSGDFLVAIELEKEELERLR